MMVDLQKIRFVATNFSVLYGLKAVPCGLFLSYIFIRGSKRDLTFDCLLLPVLVILFMWIHLYYQRTFGRVEATKEFKIKYYLLSIGVVAIGMGGFAVDLWNPIPVSFTAITFALILLWSLAWMVRRAGGKNLAIFPDGLVCIALVFLSAFLPLLGEEVFGTFGFHSGISPMYLPLLGEKVFRMFGFHSSISFTIAVVGILYALYGVLEHLFLVRSLSGAADVAEKQPV
jgi:hypothetical protein